jgi:uncharacterized protein
VDIFAVPILDKTLLYAPLHNLLALVDRRAACEIQSGLESGAASAYPQVQQILSVLQAEAQPAPQARTGALQEPLFLGLIPTRGCNLGCRYCDFPMPKQKEPLMSLRLAREAVDAYLEIQIANAQRHAEVHFFGGEPFFAEEVVHFVVNYTSLKAAELGLRTRFEVTTNGVYRRPRAEWIADHFDTVVLSLDGPADIQELHRPSLNGRSNFILVERSAQIFSQGTVELILRACVTRDTVRRLPEIAYWMAENFRPSTVSFERLTESPLSRAAGLLPPDPWEFARSFEAAAQVLEPYGIETVLSSANLNTLQCSFCPVGKDALIVSPDGAVDACYLLPEEWRRSGLDMRIGHMHSGRLELDTPQLAAVRGLTVHQKPLCTGCLCRYHCAGGCHVNHDASAAPGNYDDLCLQTRLITIAGLLQRLGQASLAQQWLADRPALEQTAWQSPDAWPVTEAWR